MRKLLLLLAVLLVLVPVAYAELDIPPPLRHNVLSNITEGVTILDTAKHEETFEWECSGGIDAYVDNDPFECSWVYGEEPNSNYIKIMRTTDTNWGIFAAHWDGPDVGIIEKTEVQGL